MKDYKKLVFWERAHLLVQDIFKVTKSFPKTEEFRLTNQILRAVYSVPANIAEGCSRNSNKDFSRFMYIALGSLNETEYFLILAKDLEYLKAHEFVKLSDKVVEIRKMLTSYIKTLH